MVKGKDYLKIDGVKAEIDNNIKYDIDNDITYIICKKCGVKIESECTSTHEYGFYFECVCGETYNK